MAGHSKWANIQHRKGKADKAKAKLFSKLAKEITVAAKAGMADVNFNPRLRLAVNNAKSVSMPKDNIQRAIDKGAGSDGANYEAIRYEGFAPGGVGLIVECSTDNKNRAATDVRTSFTHHGGNLGQTGAVSSGFENVGEIIYPPEAGTEDAIMEAALDAGASDVSSDADGHYIYTARSDLAEVAAALEGKIKTAATSTALIWKPLNTVSVEGENAEKLMKMLEELEDCDDVQNVYGNYEISEAEMARLAG
ncbi:MAG TPA: YebC/PmpR family DNA-binding transcriptional regulator [Hyphomonadaceae bacterium]|nr:YebC/PmpR family DNA-binding transcriptional regulator [Hyphomonadaceae bacterium]HPI48459.1 YebC/PmpR family DNA-binding transcriptional regulator [Hyphomonadaceae bacterium]